MLFKIIGKRAFLQHEYYRVTLRSYKDGQASPDVFSDFETNVPQAYLQEQGGEAYLITAMNFVRICDYWRSEVDSFNSDNWSEQFGDRLEQANIDFMDLDVQGL